MQSIFPPVPKPSLGYITLQMKPIPTGAHPSLWDQAETLLQALSPIVTLYTMRMKPDGLPKCPVYPLFAPSLHFDVFCLCLSTFYLFFKTQFKSHFYQEACSDANGMKLSLLSQHP